MGMDRRDFLGSLFGKKKSDPVTPEPTPQTESIPEKQFSRREILEGSGKILIAAALSGELLRSKDAFAENKTEEETALEVRDFLTEINSFNYEFRKKFGGSPKDWTLAEQDTVRSAFLARFRERVPSLLAKATNSEKGFYKTLIAGELSTADCYGLFYQHLRDTDEYTDRPIEKDDEHYAVRAADFLPTADEIKPEEIDPRIGLLRNDDRRKEEYKVGKLIEEAPAWTDPGLQKKFKTVLANKQFRDLVTNTDCTLAEVYSIIKAAINTKKTSQPTQTETEIAQWLIVEREAFKKNVLLGPETDEFIFFNYHAATKDEAQFNGDTLEEIGMIAMKRHIDGKQETDEETRKRIKRIEGTEHNAKTTLEYAIANSRGKTTIYFNTHGSKDTLSMETGHENPLDVESLAGDLCERIVHSHNPQTLKDLKIIFCSCHSYDFTTNLASSLNKTYEATRYEPSDPSNSHPTSYKKIIGVPFERIALPTIVTAAQEGSFGYTGLEKELKANEPAIKKEGKLTGELYSRRIQPAEYSDADITFFNGKNGSLLEIGAQEKQPTQKTRA